MKVSLCVPGPGPAKYARKPCTGFMNHDFTMFAEPAYTMHIKHTGKSEDKGKGKTFRETELDPP